MKLAPLGKKREFDKMRTFQFVSFQFCIILGLSLKSLLNILKPILNVHCINKKFDRSFLPLSGIDKKPIKCTFELKCNLLVSSEPLRNALIWKYTYIKYFKVY